MTQTDINSITTFIHRLNKIGINITLFANYPWIYLDTVNNIKVKERFKAEHGFTIYFTSVRPDKTGNFTDLRTIFKQIRKVLNEGQSINNSK